MIDWISFIGSALIEGVDYSIMFYGGALLNSLTAADDEVVTDFIKLKRLNRNVAIIIDSDKKGSRYHINATKKRVQKEILDYGDYSLVTNCYTIENYVPPRLLADAVAAVHPRTKFIPCEDEWQNPLGSIDHPNKPEIARCVVEAWDESTPWPFDLKKEIEKLVKFIHDAN